MELDATEALREQSRVLLLASPQERGTGLCRELLSTEHEQHVLRISYNRRPETIVDDWLTHHEALPASLAVICPESQTTDAELPDPVEQTGVAAGDLMGIGIAVLEYLDRWDDDLSIRVCIDSLSAMLQYSETEQIFRFLHTVTGRTMGAGANTHVHLDPDTQDDQTIATLSTLFDSVVDHDGEPW